MYLSMKKEKKGIYRNAFICIDIDNMKMVFCRKACKIKRSVEDLVIIVGLNGPYGEVYRMEIVDDELRLHKID